MANNRMYLVNMRNGTRIYLAKYYPSTGWYSPDGIANRLATGFTDKPYTLWGAEWKLDWEVTPEEEKEDG